MKEKESPFQSGDKEEEQFKDLFGLDPDESLLSVNYATTGNPHLNEHYQKESKENE